MSSLKLRSAQPSQVMFNWVHPVSVALQCEYLAHTTQ